MGRKREQQSGKKKRQMGPERFFTFLTGHEKGRNRRPTLDGGGASWNAGGAEKVKEFWRS